LGLPALQAGAPELSPRIAIPIYGLDGSNLERS
jgi:hypothetical protein